MTLVVDVADVGSVRLVATYPDFFSYVRPEVVAPSLNLAHHQNPFAKVITLHLPADIRDPAPRHAPGPAHPPGKAASHAS